MWGAAKACGTPWVSITSFNEWGEGTQIEAAVPRRVDVDALAPLGLALNRTMRKLLGISDDFLDYGDDPLLYLRLTKKYSLELFEAHGSDAPLGAKGEL